MLRERHLVIAAHPDDDVIGLGVHLAHVPDVIVTFATDGAPSDMVDASRLGFRNPQAYAERRLFEARRALELVGIAPERVFGLGGSDGRLTEEIAPITRRILELIRSVAPTLVWMHPYEGGHPDHDAAAVCAHAALALRSGERRAVPAAYEFTSYHAGRSGEPDWGTFLAPNQAIANLEGGSGAPPTETRILGEAERLLKRRMLACHESQRAVLGGVPLAVEATRRAPRYHFGRAPHPGQLLYERRAGPSSPSADAWRQRVQEALSTLALDPESAL
jgi:N-acetylglucosamine malate deacetylase 2